ncbi:MAG TPA: NAD(P)H-dependent oxidoreductase [Granulicella sp.]|jgi:chromate reductase|nr:NAD(P)H-dependent oxidoreductase [Granulicella sp.]
MNPIVPIRIAGLSGSLRQASFSTALIKLLAHHLQPAIELSLVEISDVPLYNEDLEGANKPAAVDAVNAALAQADAVLFVTPEYNHGIPGVLKNTLDWVSRPVFNSVLKGKPVSIITSSLAFTGGVRAQYQLRETLTAMLAHIVPGPEVAVGGVHTKFQDEAFLDQPTLDFMLSSLDRLRSEVVLRNAANAALQAAAR